MRKKSPVIFAAIAALCFSVFFAAKAFAPDRVTEARASKEAKLKDRFKEIGVAYPARRVFLRVFKREAELEVWVSGEAKGAYKLLTTYPICYVPGRLGPKRREGDNQVPEGVYRVVTFNPASSYHLSMGIDYPNKSDRILGDQSRPGGDIFIHGKCVSIGCVPIEDGPIEEVYLLSLDSRTKYRTDPTAHFFPCRMDTKECQEAMDRAIHQSESLAPFWQNLRPIYDSFEKNREPPKVTVDGQGRYVIAPR